MKGDVDRREAEVNITFHTPINLDIGLFKTPIIVLVFFCDKRLVDIGLDRRQEKSMACIFRQAFERYGKRVKCGWN